MATISYNKNKRIIILSGSIDSDDTNEVLRILIDIELSNDETPLLFIINSDGGYTDAAREVLNFMDIMKKKIITFSTGSCQSSAISIFMKGHERYCLKNTLFMVHNSRYNKTESDVSEPRLVEMITRLSYDKDLDNFISDEKYNFPDEEKIKIQIGESLYFRGEEAENKYHIAKVIDDFHEIFKDRIFKDGCEDDENV